MIETEIALNKCGDRVRVLQAAVSDVNGEMDLLSAGTFSEGYFRVEQGRMASDLTRTQAFTVDQMTLRYGAPTHMKIDVEGHEAAVLRGANDTVAKHAPLLFLELHNEMVRDSGGDPGETLNLVGLAGYRTFGVGGQPIGREEILSKPIIRIVAEHPG